MRLRLSVQRNNLPATNILWTVPQTTSQQAYTIARLLEDVNAVLPLEAEQWGLEDYIVEVEGFECLHFSPVAQTLKEDDHVSIRPLLTAEVRSRTLCGRYQISEGGQHLVDGIPFGRPYLRQPNRPAIKIPPRKRRRLNEDAVAGDQEDVAIGLITENGEATPQQNGNAHANGISGKTVHFMQTDTNALEDSEDDEEFAPSEESDDSDASTDDSSDNSSSDSDSDSEADTSSDSEAESSNSAPEILSSKLPAPAKQPAPPKQGTKDTQRRNRRRKESHKLSQLKSSGILHQDATLEDLRQYLNAHRETSSRLPYPPALKAMTEPTGKRKLLDDVSTMEAKPDSPGELERRKAELIAKLMPEGGASMPTDTLTPEKSPPTNNEASARPAKRLRPDTAAISRILARQTRAVDKKSPKAKPFPALQAPPEPGGTSDPDFWRSKINLSAFECWDEEHELSAPPFPFKQHWDPASKLMREKLNNKKKKARKSRTSEEDDEETGKLILNYGDSPETMRLDSEPGTTVASQSVQGAQETAKVDLPMPPADPDSLPPLEPADVKVGTILVFRLWVIDPKTVTPQFSGFKTAIVEKEGDSGSGAGVMTLRLADRDVPRQEAHDGASDDEEMEIKDASIWEGTFTELVTPKLLKISD